MPKPNERFNADDSLKSLTETQQELQNKQQPAAATPPVEQPQVEAQSVSIEDDLEVEVDITDEDPRDEEIKRLKNLYSTESGRRKKLSEEFNSFKSEFSAFRESLTQKPSVDSFDFGQAAELVGDDVVKTSKTIAETVTNKAVENVTNRIKALEAQLAEATANTNKKLQNNATKSLQNEVVNAIPNAMKYIKSKQIDAFLAVRPKGSVDTREQQYQRAYESGNSEVIIEILKEFERTYKLPGDQYRNNAINTDIRNTDNNHNQSAGNVFKRSNIDAYLADAERYRRKHPHGQYEKDYEDNLKIILQAQKEGRIAENM